MESFEIEGEKLIIAASPESDASSKDLGSITFDY